jgi:hypothetical protein
MIRTKRGGASGRGLALALSMAAPSSACGHAAGTRPHEMSAAQHQQAAASEQAQGAGHEGQYDADSRERRKRCAPALATNQSRICWNDSVNPTREHAAVAQRHRELAAQHRAASKALVSAENTACAGLDADDRDMSPFAHAEDIASVEPLKAQIATQGGPETREDVGATITFRAVPGLTAPWLRRIVDCHLGRNAALGHERASAEMPYCPLTLNGVRAAVREAGSGFAVDVRADDSATEKEVVRRAQRLTRASAEP